MARRKKAEIEQEMLEKQNESKVLSIILLVVTIFIICLPIFKVGPFGIISDNILDYLLGFLYPLNLCCFILCYIYQINNYPLNFKFWFGLTLINIAICSFSGLLDNSIFTITELLKYITSNFLKCFKVETLFKITGGILGNSIYTFLYSLLYRFGTVMVSLLLLLIGMILVIPSRKYIEINEKNKELKKQLKIEKQRRKEENEKRKQQEEAEKERLEEQRKLELAKSFNETHDISADEENTVFVNNDEIVNEENKEIINEPVKEVKAVKRDDVLSTKSQYFINLDENEINAKVQEDVQEDLIIKEEPIIEEAKPVEINKVKKKTNTYKLPRPFEDFLNKNTSSSSNINKTSSKVKGDKVIEILANFGINATLLNTYIGPSVTKFEIKPDSSVKVNRIMTISDNIKMELAAKDIRIEAPIPGRNAVGIEIPNVEPIPVKMIDLMKTMPKEKDSSALLFALGKDLMGKSVYCDLAKMPHLLIAGATGSGKSVCINTIITSFLFRTNPDDVKLVLVDPKKVEFTPYQDIPHLLWPIITDPTMASNMLKKIVVIMEERYDSFANVGVRNIIGFNEFVDNHNNNLTAEESPMNKLPYIVIIIDELADLMAVAGKEVELSIQRITQLARASGIHLIVATQRPSTDVITGLIKSNIPSRISFAVASSIDSRTILDQTGAERLLGNGDMLYYPQGENAPIRLQGVYVEDKEISNVTSYVKAQAKPEYEDSYFEFLTNMSGSVIANSNSVNADTKDSLYDEVVEYVKESQKASTSLLQRRFGIGYNRAARLIDTLEDRGIIGPANGSKPREVYIKDEE